MVNVEIPDALAQEIDRLAAEEHKQLTPYVAELLLQDVKRTKQLKALALSAGAWALTCGGWASPPTAFTSSQTGSTHRRLGDRLPWSALSWLYLLPHSFFSYQLASRPRRDMRYCSGRLLCCGRHILRCVYCSLARAASAARWNSECESYGCSPQCGSSASATTYPT